MWFLQPAILEGAIYLHIILFLFLSLKIKRSSQQKRGSDFASNHNIDKLEIQPEP